MLAALHTGSVDVARACHALHSVIAGEPGMEKVVHRCPGLQRTAAGCPHHYSRFSGADRDAHMVFEKVALETLCCVDWLAACLAPRGRCGYCTARIWTELGRANSLKSKSYLEIQG